MRQQALPLIVLFVFALAVRLLFLAAFGGFDDAIHDSMADQYAYLDVARNLASGHGYTLTNDLFIADGGEPTSILPPLYPLFLAGSFTIFGDNLAIVRLTQALFSSLAVVFVYLIGFRLGGRAIAIVSGSIAAIYPPLVMFSRPIMSEAIFVPLLTGLIWLSLKLAGASPPRWGYPVWGVVAGVLVLTRSESLMLVLAIVAALAARAVLRSGWRSLAPLTLALLPMIAILAPYSAYNVSIQGTLMPVANKRWSLWDNTWWAEARNSPEWANVELPERVVTPDWETKTELERDRYLFEQGMTFIREHPGIYLRQRVKELLDSYPLLPREELPPPLGRSGVITRPDGHAFGPTSLDDSVYYVSAAEKTRVWFFRLTFALALAGGVLAVRQRRLDGVLLLLIVVWNAGNAFVFGGAERFRWQIDPLLIVLAASALVCGWLWVTARQPKLPYRLEATGVPDR